MKVGDLVRYKNIPSMYGTVTKVRSNAWVGMQCEVVWVCGWFGKDRLCYAISELEVINESR